MRKTFFVSAVLVILAAVGMATGIEALWASKVVVTKPKTNGDIQAVKSVLKRYREAKAVSLKVEKKITRSLLGDEKVSRGKLHFSRGKLRLEIESPEKNLLVADQKQLWMAVELPEDLGGKTHVTKLSLRPKKGEKSQARSHSLVALLFGDDAVWDQFTVVESSEKDGIKTLELRPKEPTEMEDLTRVQVRFDEKEKLIVGIEYADDLDNVVAYSFSNADFKAKVAKDQFVYRPPKGAEVVEY